MSNNAMKKKTKENKLASPDKFIDINFLRTEMTQAVYDGKLSGEHMETIFGIIAKWRKQNEYLEREL